MEVRLLGTGGPRGWPEPGCGCASCSAMRRSGRHHPPTSVLVDGVLRLGARGVPPAVPPGYGLRAVAGGWELTGPRGHRLLYAAGPDRPASPGAAPPDTAGDGGCGRPYGAVLLDLVGDPDRLGRLRARGLVGAGTVVVPVHLDHRVPSPEELARRLSMWGAGAGPAGPWRVLVLGGARSGKSAEAELRLAAAPHVTYAATAPDRPGDRAWRERVRAHRERRPARWRTVETADITGLLHSATGALLVDSVGAWLARVMDAHGAWAGDGLPAGVRTEIERLVAAWRSTRCYAVAVSDDVSGGIVPGEPGSRLFRDVLGTLNQRLAVESEEVTQVVAGRTIALARRPPGPGWADRVTGWGLPPGLAG